MKIMRITGKIRELNVEPVSEPAATPKKVNPIPSVNPAEFVPKPQPVVVPVHAQELQKV